jgi:phosphoribosylformylglycinamidine synthase
MVGLIEKAEHITTQWFKDEGDAIVLLGDAVDSTDPVAGLGGSAYLQVVHRTKNGSPPRCDLDKARTLHDAVRSLILGGSIKSAHDCSEGGLLVAIAESCVSRQEARGAPRLIGARIDLSAFAGCRLDALLFGETQNRVVLGTAAIDAVKVVAQAKILGVPAAVIGTVGGSTLEVKTTTSQCTWQTSELHDCWWSSIARAMR